MPTSCDKRGSNTLFAGPCFISPSSIFPVGHHTTRRSLVHCGRLRRQGHSREQSPQELSPHAVHLLDKTDYIYVMDGGVIIEQGKYKVNSSSVVCRRSPNRLQDLTANSVVFRTSLNALVSEHRPYLEYFIIVDTIPRSTTSLDLPILATAMSMPCLTDWPSHARHAVLH